MTKYSFSVAWSEADGAYLALCPEFPGLSAFGETVEQAITEIETAVELAVETFQENGWELPCPRAPHSYSGQLRVRLPKQLHAKLATQAESDGVSLNTLIVSYLSESLGARAIYQQVQHSVSSAVDAWQESIQSMREQLENASTRMESTIRGGESRALASINVGETESRPADVEHIIKRALRAREGKLMRDQLHSWVPREEAGEVPRGTSPRYRVLKYLSEDWLESAEKVAALSNEVA